MAPKLSSNSIQFFLFIFLLHLLIIPPPPAGGQIDYGYYDKSCIHLPDIVRTGVQQAFRANSRIAPSLLRLHFLDCFPNGCDASILLEDTSNLKGEKGSIPPIVSSEAFEVIDRIKEDVEEECPSKVSCADILTLAARESVSLAGGPFYDVQLGRLDGIKTSDPTAIKQLPDLSAPLDEIIKKFELKGINSKDFVALLGGHILGHDGCLSFEVRLNSVRGPRKLDPNNTLLPAPLSSSRKCPTSSPNRDGPNPNKAPADYKFDNSYYLNLKNNGGLLQSEQALTTDSVTFGFVNAFCEDQDLFFSDFVSSILKVSELQLLVGKDRGEIRKNCSSVN